ncbi:DUF2125 domain-containing protein [Ensifer soli]|uniref:DUF2125 domain-containing protein n=1 Tax=Ciceribacter sp. sgz301302 TaxID=3342379 RepID=UPI0035B6B0C6
MTADDNGASTRASRKFRILITAVFLTVVLYSAAWFAVAREAETRITEFLGAPGIDGVTGACANPAVRGYPFRFGLFCDTLALDDHRKGVSVSLGALRSAAQVYDPGRIVAEIDGPGELRVSPGLSLFADWERARTSLRASLSGLDRLSAEVNGLNGTLMPAFPDDPLGFTAPHGELHLRRNGADLDLAASAEALALAIGEERRALPAITAAADLTFVDRAGLLSGGPVSAGALRGSRGEIRSLTLTAPGGLTASASGPFSIDADGRISGDLSLAVRNVEAWRDAITAALPEAGDVAGNIAGMLSALANGDGEARVTLTLRDGTAYLAFIPLGELPEI